MRAISPDNRDEDGLFRNTSWETEMFWREPFGFDLSKLENYFRTRRDEVIDEQKKRYDEYLSDAWVDIDGDWKKQPDNFEQWLSVRLFPYTKRWFEYHAWNLIVQLKSFQADAEEDASGRFVAAPRFGNRSLMESAFKLGRMVEHYRWKFQHESIVVQRRKQSQNAGKGGGASSSGLRPKRLEEFLCAVEALADFFPKMSEAAIVDQAFKDASKTSDSFWKLGAGQAEKYATTLRSDHPYRSRYYAIFGKNA